MSNYTDKKLLNAIGLSYGELSLKGKNRGQFEKKLRNKINKVLKGLITSYLMIYQNYMF